MKIFLWSPFISKVATIKAVINSAISIKKYSNNEVVIVDSFGEWNEFRVQLKKNNIKILKINKNYKKDLSNQGYINSRLSFLKIFFISFFPLKRLITKEKPDYFIAHLITSLPLLLFLIYKFKTKLIIRVSGLVNFNLFRKFFWNLCSKIIYRITLPTLDSLKDYKKLQIIKNAKLFYVPDPLFAKFQNVKKNNNLKIKNKNYILSIGRLTNQKNHKFLIKCFYEISKKIKYLQLIILGDGENRASLEKLIKELSLEKKVILKGYVKNPEVYIKNALCLVSTSLWEDPGFAIIEALNLKTIVISSDCPNGPKELLSKKSGFLFKSNDYNHFIKVFFLFWNKSKFELSIIKKKGKLISNKFSFLNHFLKLKRVLNL